MSMALGTGSLSSAKLATEAGGERSRRSTRPPPPPPACANTGGEPKV